MHWWLLAVGAAAGCYNLQVFQQFRLRASRISSSPLHSGRMRIIQKLDGLVAREKNGCFTTPRIQTVHTDSVYGRII